MAGTEDEDFTAAFPTGTVSTHPPPKTGSPSPKQSSGRQRLQHVGAGLTKVPPRRRHTQVTEFGATGVNSTEGREREQRKAEHQAPGRVSPARQSPVGHTRKEVCGTAGIRRRPAPPRGGRSLRCRPRPPAAESGVRSSRRCRGGREVRHAVERGGSAEERSPVRPGRREGAVDWPPAVRYPPRPRPRGSFSGRPEESAALSQVPVARVARAVCGLGRPGALAPAPAPAPPSLQCRDCPAPQKKEGQ